MDANKSSACAVAGVFINAIFTKSVVFTRIRIRAVV